MHKIMPDPVNLPAEQLQANATVDGIVNRQKTHVSWAEAEKPVRPATDPVYSKRRSTNRPVAIPRSTGSFFNRAFQKASRGKKVPDVADWASLLGPSSPQKAAKVWLSEEQGNTVALSSRSSVAQLRFSPPSSPGNRSLDSGISSSLPVSTVAQARSTGQDVLQQLRVVGLDEESWVEKADAAMAAQGDAGGRSGSKSRSKDRGGERRRVGRKTLENMQQQAHQKLQHQLQQREQEARQQQQEQQQTQQQRKQQLQQSQQAQPPPSPQQQQQQQQDPPKILQLLMKKQKQQQEPQPDLPVNTGEMKRERSVSGSGTAGEESDTLSELQSQQHGQGDSKVLAEDTEKKGWGSAKTTFLQQSSPKRKSSILAGSMLDAVKALAGGTAAADGAPKKKSVKDRMALFFKGKDSRRSFSEQIAEEAKAEAGAAPPEPPDLKSETEEAKPTPTESVGFDFFSQSQARKKEEEWKTVSKSFEAPLRSFQELVNVENSPMLLSDAVERLRHMCGGQNFTWERPRGAYGGKINITFPIIMWYQHSWENEIKKSRTACSVRFLHQPGCAYLFQPTVPLTTLIIEPKQTYRPMFDHDPRSFHVFKLAWRHFLDFGSTDYRSIVGEQLERWTGRCKIAIEKPLNATYWLMLMVGSHARETLVARRMVKTLSEPSERVPVICVDSFVSLSALLFSPERQVLFAGVDPTPSYLRWLQYVGDQNFGRKTTQERAQENLTVFEMNEFLDLPVIIIFYGRPQAKAEETDPLAWVGNPTLVRSYIARYAEDNRCARQLEHACRLYTYSCSLGLQKSSADEKTNKQNPYYCWNGLRVCEIGVPIPSTQAAFLSPFVNTRQVAMLCPVHGPDAAAGPSPDKAKKRAEKPSAEKSATAADQSEQSPETQPGAGNSSTRKSRPSWGGSSEHDSSAPENLEEQSSDHEEDGTESTTSGPGHGEGSRGSRNSVMSAAGGRVAVEKRTGASSPVCTCGQYMMNPPSASPKRAQGQQQGQHTPQFSAAGDHEGGPEVFELRQALNAIADYDLFHTFIAVLSGALNLAKMVLRLHFSIDAEAYRNLPSPACHHWQDSMMPWYREFHRVDIHCRSRYGMLLTSVLRGLFGDGFTSGLHYEALDFFRMGGTEQTEQEGDSKTKLLQEAMGGPRAPIPRQRASINLNGIRRPSMFGPGMPRSSTIFLEKEVPEFAPSQPAAIPELNAEGLKKDKAVKSLLSNLQVWCELLGSESPVSTKMHFEVFNQWCHSAHLIPFMLRCYRRCGIAGLADGQHVGSHKHGTNPFHPLVLPTVPDFCYGHCYPFHKVLQYFYGGTEQIVCSIDDSREVDAVRQHFGLIPGQDRLNNQCWFQVRKDLLAKEEQQGLSSKSSAARATHNLQSFLKSHSQGGDGQLNKNMLKELEAFVSSSKSSPNGSRKSVANQQGSFGRPTAVAPKHSVLLSKSESGPKGEEDKSRTSVLVVKKPTPSPSSMKRQVAAPLGPGKLSASDPFFWFCHGDFSLYTYPANMVPRNYLHDATALYHKYSDVVSRSGTPSRREPDGSADVDDQGYKVSLKKESAPPSICLCQPTELVSRHRARFHVQKNFADDEHLLLGDAGWFPGALGYRFTFEAKTEDVQRYVLLSSMPQASLVYIEHIRVPSKKTQKSSAKTAHAADDRKEASHVASSEGEDDVENSSGEDDSGLGGVRQKLPYFKRRRRKNRIGTSAQKDGKGTVDIMLPPLLPS